MKIYSFVVGHISFDDGYVVDHRHDYTTFEEAQKAKEWWDSLPDMPYDQTEHKSHIEENMVSETFVPWLSPQVEARLRQEWRDYMDEEEARERQCEYEEDQYLRYLEESDDAVSPGD